MRLTASSPTNYSITRLSNYPILLALFFTCTAAVHAHHSITAVYDFAEPVRLEGVITAFHFVNPHPSVEIQIASADGSAESWRLELDNLSELVAVGMSADSFRIGDGIVVNGSKARDKSRRLYVRSLERRSDGFLYEQVGSSPRVRSSPR